MLQVVIPANEYYINSHDMVKIVTVKEQVLQLEHSLISISKWEEKWNKPFLTEEPLTEEEQNDYVRCMTITKNVDPNTYISIPNEVINKITTYMNASMTATTFSEIENKSYNPQVITSELIYYWMSAYRLPVEYEKWHLNRLITLLHICNIKNAPPKKTSTQEMYARRRALNKQRREAMHSRG